MFFSLWVYYYVVGGLCKNVRTVNSSVTKDTAHIIAGVSLVKMYNRDDKAHIILYCE